ncbi:MAG TPA: bifunctional 4-hydroxy-2-oxoglutarate aldolase/2-dehydro-3-deoxy-phosphogluconate aldolase [Candidatus Limnocylindria bacterium]|nr:bifunctional 4-hydroxy-2-oxoglutarate aldolase/2-dehydro-3-deoxy-phosphogluconate aldolase [Candidatus Limnocylindria bacterium]
MTAETLRAGPIADAIRRQRLLVVLRRVEPRDRLLALVDELAAAGARIFEVTFDAPTAAEDIAALRDRLEARDGGPYVVGAGTIVSDGQLAAARACGAQFGVSPLFDPPLVRGAVEGGMPFIPGAFTPTEVASAWATGATFVKLFPASAVGPQFVRELRGPLPEIQLIPTGGIDASNAPDFLEAGAVAVGIGSALTRAGAEARQRIVAGLRAE